MKDYPPDLFSGFGFMIIDEVHHISSQTFSELLFRVVTPFTLGLSATMTRKDGTTPIFKMFLGEVLHKAERSNSEKGRIQVYGIQYKSHDSTFEEPVLDFRGKPQISTMISRVCSYSYRTDFALKVLIDFITIPGVPVCPLAAPPCAKCGNNHNFPVELLCCNNATYCIPCIDSMPVENEGKGRVKCPACGKRRASLRYRQHYQENAHIMPVKMRQTIVLAHNLDVLQYLYRRIVCKNIASVGFYVGGMKEVELKWSEKQQVILATYQMAAEALDISTLNAELLLTPKTDVVQTVGRIGRSPPDGIRLPNVLIDLYDTHEVFCNQWRKRRAYYKKSGFTITTTDSDRYRPEFLTVVGVNVSVSDNDEDEDDGSESEEGKKEVVSAAVCRLPLIVKSAKIKI